MAVMADWAGPRAGFVTNSRWTQRVDRRLAAQRSRGKALVAVQDTILVAIWNMAQTGALYDDLGADQFTLIQPIRTKRRAIRQLQELATPRPSYQLNCYSGNLRVS